MKRSPRLPMAILVAGWFSVELLRAQDAATITSIQFGSLRMDVQFAATPGGVLAVETSPDLAHWTVEGFAPETLPGIFNWDDSSPIRHSRRFYRPFPAPPAAQSTWLASGLMVPENGLEMELPPTFAWELFPSAAGVSYQFEFCDATDDGDGGLTPLLPPLMVRSGLNAATVQWPDEGLWPPPGGRYLWRVTAVNGSRCWPGRWIRSPGVALSHNRVRAVSAAGPRGGAPVDWNRVIKLMNELTEKKNKIARELDGNEALAQLELIRRLAELLQGLDAVKEALDSWLNAPTPALPSAERLLQVLCFFDSAGEVMLKLDKRMPGKVKQALRQLTNQVHQWKVLLQQTIENHGDTAALIQQIVNQLRAILQQSRFDGSGLWDYLVGWIKDKALEKLKEILEEELGEAAGGALLSILTDIYWFLHAVEKIGDLEALCRTYNRTVLQAIAAGTWALPPDWEYFGTVRTADRNCQFTIRPYKKCFVPHGPGPFDGEWERTGVRFSDGSTGKTERFENANMTNNGDGTWDFKYSFDLLDADLACTPGARCLLLAEVCVVCPGATEARDGCYHFFIQPLPCP